MTEQKQSEKAVRCIRIGPDQVTITENEVVIEARHEMPDWEVRSSKAPAIYFEDRKYLLTEKRPAHPPFAIRYVLQPWPEGKVANDKIFHTYDEEAVAQRDSSRRGDKLDEMVWVLLLPFYPFLGFLWSGAQQRLVRFGYLPRSITGISIFTTFGLMLAQGVFAVVTINASIRSGKIMVGGILRALMSQDHFQIGPVGIPATYIDCLILLALVADLAIRYSNYLREDQWTGGFLEWLVPQSLRRK